jgi:hypothetical protein
MPGIVPAYEISYLYISLFIIQDKDETSGCDWGAGNSAG